ncbi:MAG: hypothetical protein JNK67_14725 [Alphaproteobacteria bacterium]|nr:hypothetical protein [Alphaproteobacteria bacterium]
MADAMRYAGQALVLALLAVAIGFFASRPTLEYFPVDAAQIKLSFAHGSQRVAECRRLSVEEIARLPAKDRRPNTCARERVPIRVQLLLDGRPIYDEVLQPTGLARDGPARVYRKFQVPPGRHEITARLRDSGRTEGFDHERKLEVELKPLQNLAVDYKSDHGTFDFR